MASGWGPRPPRSRSSRRRCRCSSAPTRGRSDDRRPASRTRLPARCAHVGAAAVRRHHGRAGPAGVRDGPVGGPDDDDGPRRRALLGGGGRRPVGAVRRVWVVDGWLEGVVGWVLSRGGYVTCELWRQAGGRVSGLVLATTRAGADTPEGAAGR